VPFPPALAIFAGVDILITVRGPVTFSQYSPLTYCPDPQTSGSRRSQLKLRRACRIV
jgi:hypothetical protein